MPQLSLVGYHLTFDDEFGSLAPLQVSPGGTTQFNDAYVFGNWLYNNNEAEYYVDPSSGIVNPFLFQNGALVITAQPTVAGEATQGQPYTSGLLTTAHSFSQNQGYFEIRCETPATQGFWPAFWLLPQGGGGTPEIDVLEQPNLNGASSYWSYARPGATADNGGGWINTNANLSATYNTYGMLWTPNAITFYCDGLQVGTSIAVPANFTEQMYLLVNLAVGGIGSWPGTPGTATTAQLKVDYIRVYSDNPADPAVPQQAISSPDGVNTTPSYAAPAGIVVPSVTIGPDTLSLFVSEDYWLNDAQFTLSIDGVQQGGTLTAVAAHAMGQSETFQFAGTFGSAAHVVAVDFLNDAYGGASSADVNLYVTSAELNGVSLPGASLTELNDGSQSFRFAGYVAPVLVTPTITLAAVTVIPSSALTVDVLSLQIAETPGLADARFTISIDGVQQGGTQTTTAIESLGQIQSFVINGSFAVGAHTVGVTLLNPTGPAGASGLFVQSATLDGAAVPRSGLSLVGGAPQAFAFTELAANVIVGSGPDTLTLHVSEDAYHGNALFTVAVNGVQQGGTLTAQATNLSPYTPLLAQSQLFGIEGSFAGSNVVTVTFLNDAYGGSATTDRDLYVMAAEIDGVTIPGGALNEPGPGPQSFGFTNPTPITVVAAPPVVVPDSVTVGAGSGPDTLALNISQDAYLGDALFTVAINGVQQGGTLTAQATNLSPYTPLLAQSQVFAFQGSFAGRNVVTVTFLNDAYGGSATTDRDLYVVAAQIDGVAITGGVLNEPGPGPQSFGFTNPTPLPVSPPPPPPVWVPTVLVGSGPDTLTLEISEDAYLGNALFTISVNGVQQGGTLTALATDAAPYTPLLARSQVFDIQGSFSGPGIVTVDFLNDAYGGTAATDRNLYLIGAAIDGAPIAGGLLNEPAPGPQSFNFTAVARTTVVAGVTVTQSGTATPDVLILQMAEIPGLADASFTISVDGVQQGGTLTATALQGQGQMQAFVVNGGFAFGAHSVSLALVNPTGAAAAQGLDVLSASLNGTALAGGTFSVVGSAALGFTFTKPSLPTITIGTGPDTLLLGVSEHAYLGDARFTISVDGVQQGGTLTALASQALGQSQNVAVTGNFGVGPQTVTVNFLNGLNAGTPATDRSLYITSLSKDGVQSAVDQASLLTTGTVTLIADNTVTPDTITFALTENAYAGDAQVALSLDGRLLAAPSVTFLNSAGVSQLFSYTGDFGGPALAHVATVDLLNSINGGTPQTDRNVYVQSITIDGAVSAMPPVQLFASGPTSYMLTVPH